MGVVVESRQAIVEKKYNSLVWVISKSILYSKLF
jgi:hypothetical protein